MNRRKFIRIAGSTAIIFAGAGTGSYAWVNTRRPTKALLPWESAGSDNYDDPRIKALSYAILAPNPHNRQPWLVDLKTPNRVVLFCDTDRLLPHTDPFNRQIVLGHGCFIEQLDIAARSLGFSLEITLFPEGSSEDALDKRPITSIDFTPNASVAKDSLFNQIIKRRTNKETYDTKKPVELQKALAICESVGRGITADYTLNSDSVSFLRDLTLRANVLEFSTPYTWKETVDLMRIGKREIENNPDGIDLGGAFLEGLSTLGQISRKQMVDINSIAFKQTIEMYTEKIKSSMGFVWLVTQGNTRQDQINAGRSWLRMNLKATELGIAINPHSQALQEFREMEKLSAELNEKLGINLPNRIQMFARIGYGPDTDVSPRWAIEDKIIS
jgi:hypothetical protein